MCKIVAPHVRADDQPKQTAVNKEAAEKPIAVINDVVAEMDEDQVVATSGSPSVLLADLVASHVGRSGSDVVCIIPKSGT